MSQLQKAVPSSIGIFGASGHIGEITARWLRYHAPHIKLRLISSSAGTADQLRTTFPDCEVALGNYYDVAALTDAVEGLEGLFVVTPNATPEEVAMTNVVSAVRRSDTLVHMVRTVSVYPAVNPRRVPAVLVENELGLEVQHPIACRVLYESGLPVTYLNLGATFMDNFLRMPMLSPGKLTWPSRRVPFIDPRDVGEAVARILTSDNARHFDQLHTLNNGADFMDMREAVEVMQDVLFMDIEYDPSRAGFTALLESAGAPQVVSNHLWDFFRYEDANDVAWSLNDCLERILGRKPTTLRSWLQEHRQQLSERLAP